MKQPPYFAEWSGQKGIERGTQLVVPPAASAVVRDRRDGPSAGNVCNCGDDLQMAERIARLLNDEEVLKEFRRTAINGHQPAQTLRAL